MSGTLLVSLCVVISEGDQPPRVPKILSETWPTYAEASTRAAKERRPLVVFVGVPARPIPGATVCNAAALVGVSGQAVVIAKPDGRGWLAWEATLPATATDAAIRAAIKPAQAQGAWQPATRPALLRRWR